MDSHLRVEEAEQESDLNFPELASVIAFESTIASELADSCQWRGKETILLVEDEALVRKAMGEALQIAGYQVMLAESATQALEIYQKCLGAMDLLIADVVLPGISGEELALTLFGLCPHLRIILMSGYMEQFALRKLSAYQMLYLAKPFVVSTLLKRVREVLDSNPPNFGASA